MKFATIRLMQFFLCVEKIMGEMKLHQIIFLLQQKGFNYELYYKYENDRLYSSELDDEIDFLSNIGFINEFYENIEKIYTLNTDFTSKIIPGELEGRERDFLDLLLETDQKTLSDAAMIYYFKNYNSAEDEAIQNKIRGLAPDLFNNMAPAHALFREIESF